MLRDASLVAGANLEYLLRGGLPKRQLIIGGGMLAVAVAVAFAAGADPRGWMVSGQPGMVPALLATLAPDDTGTGA